MPTYCFICSKCGVKESVFRPGMKRPVSRCPQCHGRMATDFQAETVASGNQDYAKEVLSDAMGVHPNQVAQHRKMFPDVPMTDTGEVIVRNHAEGKRIRKILGFHDKAGYVD